MPSVTTNAIPVGNYECVVQNLGPDALYVGEASVTAENGIELASGKAIGLSASDWNHFVISAGTSDVRICGRANGIFDAPAAS